MPDLDSSLVKKALYITVRGQRFVVIVVYIYMASFCTCLGWIESSSSLSWMRSNQWKQSRLQVMIIYLTAISLGMFCDAGESSWRFRYRVSLSAPLEASRGVKGWWRMINPWGQAVTCRWRGVENRSIIKLKAKAEWKECRNTQWLTGHVVFFHSRIHWKRGFIQH